VLGSDVAGVVVALGEGVTSFAVGDRVFGFDDARWGGHAELAVQRVDRGLAVIPDGTSFAEAVSTVEGTHYADAFLRSLRLGPRHRVLVNGATGAIGVAATQLVKRTGAHVTAVCEGEHAELVRSLGADVVIDRTREDFTRSNETYDVVLDAVGKSSFWRCKRLLVPKGTYVSSDLGPKSSNPLLALVTPWFGGRRVRFPIPGKPTPEEFRRLAGLLADGGIKPVIDRRYALDEIPDAYRYVESGRKIGTVVIDLERATSG
jgi:NADPH:quinone reductase-like Zn-dependent oxidoreductase